MQLKIGVQLKTSMMTDMVHIPSNAACRITYSRGRFCCTNYLNRYTYSIRKTHVTGPPYEILAHTQTITAMKPAHAMLGLFSHANDKKRNEKE
jgi:hypothetical protein